LKLRLAESEVNLIKKTAQEVFGPCRVFIFGSRLREKRGGDIDIFVIPENRESLFAKRVKLTAKLENLLEKPVDVVVSYDLSREIEREALRGVEI